MEYAEISPTGCRVHARDSAPWSVDRADLYVSPSPCSQPVCIETMAFTVMYHQRFPKDMLGIRLAGELNSVAPRNAYTLLT